MKKQLKPMAKVRRLLFAILIAAFAVLLIVIAWALQSHKKAIVAGWGDSEGGRSSYTLEEINADALGNSIVFNSISNSVVGNEKNFVGVLEHCGSNEAGTDNSWQANEIEVKDGQEYIVRAYIHNNSIREDGGISQNTKVAFNIPKESDTNIPVHGFIFSDNATPNEYWDGVLFKSDHKFHLEYIYGSALLENNGIGANGLPLSDEIVTKAASNNGTLIGYDALDGRVPGGYKYVSYVSIKVLVVFDSDYTVEHKVRLIGGSEWGKTVTAQVGDEVEFQIQYKNIGENGHENVMIRDILPESLEYVPGSTRVYNSDHKDGLSIEQDYLVTEKAINIGNYSPGANAYIRFRAIVLGDNLQLGSNTLVSWSQCGVGEVTLQDFAAVTVNKTE